MIRRIADQEPFTMYPNRYIDIIKPKLTGTQRDICDVVIRMTYGWHRTDARISNAEFVERTGRSERAVIKAKKVLIDMGLLVSLEDGGGKRTSLYTLDIYYGTDKSTKRVPTRHDDQVEASDPPDMTTYVNEVVSESCHSEGTDFSACPSEMDYVDEAVADISGTTDPPKPIMTPDDADPTPELSAAPLIDNSIYINKETNKEDISNDDGGTADNPSGGRRQAALVRSEFIKYFPEAMNGNDWGLFGWAARDYGVDTCEAKIQWMREYGRTNPINNPKGLFRMALRNDYQPSAFIRAKMHGDEKARRAIEHGRRRAEEWREMVENFDYDTASASLQKLIDTIG